MPGIIPSVEAALYKMNVNGAADVPHNGRRCQHYLKLRGLNSEQREERDEGLIFIIAAAPTMVSHDLAKTGAVAMGLWRARRYGRYRGQGRQSASGAYGRDSRARLAFVSPRIITAIIDRASVVSLREAEAKDRLNND
jgi:hypothetical protein